MEDDLPFADPRSMDLDNRIGASLSTDYFLLRTEFTPAQIDHLTRTRAFVEQEVLPEINDYWERAEFPRPLIEKLAKVGIVGDGIAGYGCPDIDPLSAGLITMELSRGDGSLATFVGVQGGLAMRSIAMLGSEEQKRRWLAPMARLEALGAFALTEPDHGSDSIALETTARRDGDHWVLDGHKKWIGNGSIADVVVVWARDVADGRVKGFLVEKGTPGYAARVIEGKGSLRAVWQAEIDLVDLRVPEANRLPGAKSFRDTASVLAATRVSCAWAALGHAVAGYDAALTYAKRRAQFGKPLVSFQLIQSRLVKMLAKVTAMQLYCRRIADLQAAGTLDPTLAGLAKMHNTTTAREVLAEARDLLGGNGILLDFHVIRHMSDIEAIHTYEGTEAMQTLIVGRDVTGVSAFA
jgi:glutaryl-CoA dehydrogenase